MRIEHDIFDLIGSGSRYHSAIITCFSFDPVFFSNLYLPNLRSAGPRNILVLVDASNYDAVLDGFDKYGDMVPEMQCHLVRMTPTSTGVFHSKMVLLFGKKDTFIAVGSGNLTYSGYLRNDELWGAFQISGESSPNYPILRQVWHYLLDLLPKDDAIDRQISWIRENCPCIATAEQNSEEFAIVDGHTRAYFVGNSKNHTIFSQVSDIIGGKTVASIKVISPFYDQKGLLGSLQDRYAPIRLSLIFDPNSQLLPHHLRENWHPFEWNHSNKRLHGKAFQFETDDKTILVIGSANSTVAAWGNDSFYSNDEACIVLVSDGKEDYFDDLEIRLDKEAEFPNQNKVGYPVGESKNVYDYHILSCICNAEGVFFITLDKEISEGKLAFLDRCGKILSKEIVSSSKCRLQLKVDYNPARKMVALSGDDDFVSNKCLILSELQLQGMNPDGANRKLDQLLELTPDWEGQLEEILSYAGYHSVKWDELRPNTSGARKAGVDKQKEEKTDIGIGREAFDHVILGGGLPPHVAAHVKIADFLNARLKGSSMENDFSEHDPMLSQKEKDSGLPPDDAPNGKRTEDNVDNKTKTVSVYKSLMSFCSKVEKSYDDAIAKKQRKSNGIPEQFEIEPTLDDFSIFATVVISTFYCQLHEDKAYKFNWFRFILSFTSKFLYIFRTGYPEGQGYSYNKLQELQKDASVYVLLLLSHFYWERKDALVEVLVLNLLDSLPDKESIIERYENDLKANSLEYRTDSVIKLSAIINKFFLLEDATAPFESISDGELSKRKSIGYSCIRNNKKGSKGVNSYECLHPAFMNDPLIVKCRDLVPVSRVKNNSEPGE